MGVAGPEEAIKWLERALWLAGGARLSETLHFFADEKRRKKEERRRDDDFYRRKRSAEEEKWAKCDKREGIGVECGGRESMGGGGRVASLRK